VPQAGRRFEKGRNTAGSALPLMSATHRWLGKRT
jgi:hypothetical protein